MLKLESLTADEYEDDVFEMRKLPQVDAVGTEEIAKIKPLSSGGVTTQLERILSLGDAYIVRGDLAKATEVLREGEALFANHPELIKRFKIVNQRNLDSEPSSAPPTGIAKPLSREQTEIEGKIELLARSSRPRPGIFAVYRKPNLNYFISQPQANSIRGHPMYDLSDFQKRPKSFNR